LSTIIDNSLSQSSSLSPNVIPVAKKGRPKKSDIEAKKKRAVVGRPPGEAARLQELKARLLATTGDKVINKVVEIALTDGHPVQAAALKMCMDRVLPVSMFEKDAAGGRSAVTINITGLNTQPVVEDNVMDIDFQDVETR
jgi:hypothetical protein